MSCHHTPVHLHFGSDLVRDLSQQTVPARTTFVSLPSSPQGEQKARACSLCSAAKTNVLHAFTDSLIHSENHHAPPVWPCSPPSAQRSSGLDGPAWPATARVPTPSPGSTACSPLGCGKMFCCHLVVKKTPAGCRAASQFLPSPETSQALAQWPQLGAPTPYQWIIRQIFERTRVQGSMGFGPRPPSLPSHHGTAPLHSMPLQRAFYFSRRHPGFDCLHRPQATATLAGALFFSGPDA